jgi:hypothetical protein
LEAGITYLPDNRMETIAAGLRELIISKGYERNATRAARETYGPKAVASALDLFLKKVKQAARSRFI